MYKTDERTRQLLDISQRLEGLKRHTGIHAAGTVIVPTDGGKQISDYVPVARRPDEPVTTQFNDKSLVDLGILKIDFLGLRTLTVLSNAEKLVRARHDPKFDLYDLPLDDKNTYKLLSEAHTRGVFQLESGGMKDLLMKLKPQLLRISSR